MRDNTMARARAHLYAQKPQSAAGAAAIASLQVLNQSVREADELALRDLKIGPLDARALLYVVQGARDNRVVIPTDLATMLRVSSAAITKLVDRLVQAGRVERHPNPKDRRGVVLVPAGTAAEDLARAYGHMHSPLVAVIDDLPDSDLEAVTRFASRLAEALQADNLTSRAGHAPAP